MTQKARRMFSADQKAAAVAIVKQSGKPISQVAEEMGLTESALRKWVKQAAIEEGMGSPGSLTTQERGIDSLAQRPETGANGARLPKKGSDLLCSGKLRHYELIHAEKAHYPINLMCRVLNQSRSGYYAWRNRPLSRRTKENALLSQRIKQIHACQPPNLWLAEDTGSTVLARIPD